MDFCGRIYSPQNTILSKLLLPFGEIKNLFQRLYHLILQTMWRELLSGEKIDYEYVNLFLFIIFCILSLLFYYLRYYHQPILITFFILWLIDIATSKKKCQQSNAFSSVFTTLKEDTVQIITQSSQQGSIHLEYDQRQLAFLAIAQSQIYSQSFQTVIGTLWQVIFELADGTRIIIDEKSSPHQALSQAKQITSELAIPIPIHFLDSKGNSHYTASELPVEQQTPSHQINVTHQGQQWHIYSQWRLRDTWQLLKQIVSEIGFILFVLIITNFMIKFGGILHSLLASYFGFDTQTIILSISDIISWFNPNIGEGGYLELIIAITLMMIQGIIISQTKHLYIDENCLTYRVSNNSKQTVPTSEIETILWITFPKPMILIVGDQTTIGIQKLPTQQAYPELLLKTEQALQSSQITSSE